jgi:aldose 1-epimerase
MKLSYIAAVGLAAIGLGACGSDSQPARYDSGFFDMSPRKDSPTADLGRDTPTPQPDLQSPIEAAVDGLVVVDTIAPVDQNTPEPDSPISLDGGQPDAPPNPIDQAQATEAGATEAGAVDQISAPADGGIRFNAAYVELKRQNFQAKIGGKDTDLFTIKNSKGVFAKLTNYGARFEQIVVPDKDGVFGDVVLGYETIDAVKNGQASMGAFIGRYANRIGGGVFVLDGIVYSIPTNEAAPMNNLLHGGAKGSRYRVFDATQLSDSSVQMRLTFLDAEDSDLATSKTGFPGTVELTVVYSVTETNEIHIDYAAKSLDKMTVINLTSHSFFNLGNNPATQILDHVIKVNADKVLENDDHLLPTGVLRDVTGTPMDFRTAKTFRKDYQADYDLLKLVGGGGTGVAGGYDNHYVLNKATEGQLSLAASAYEPISGRTMEVWSTEPGMQLFTGQNLTGQAGRDVGKGNATYMPYYGFCMEPSHYPDSPRHDSFPSTTLNANQTYQGSIVYKFSVAP